MSDSFSLVYGTNIWSHHQIPVATALADELGHHRFKMALFEEVPDERRHLGWSEPEQTPWVIGPPRDAGVRETLIRACLDADVMVFGSCPMGILDARVKAGKITLVSSERMLKKPFHRLRLLNPRYAKGIAEYRNQVNHENVYALAIGHYAPADLERIEVFLGRVWRWGYFIDVPEEIPPRDPAQPVEILWAGRMLDWKRLDLLLGALSLIKQPVFHCTIVGDGPERNRLKDLARRLKLDSERVTFLPPVPFAEVRGLMRDSDIYVLSSNMQEGWGVVASEAMSEGCVLVANDQAGASRELIQDGQTGFLFRDGDKTELAEIITRLCLDDSMRMATRNRAWRSMRERWNPQTAARRLINLCSSLLGGEDVNYSSGPCAAVAGWMTPGEPIEGHARKQTVRL